MSPLHLVRRSWGRSRKSGRSTLRASGQTLVEFALVIPIFLLLLFALLDFGRVIYAQQTITNDAREGARKGLVAANDTTINQATYDKIRTAALVMTPGVTLANANITGHAGACTATAADTTSATTCFFPNGVTCGGTSPYVEVNIAVTVPMLTPLLSNLVGGSIAVSTRSITYLPC